MSEVKVNKITPTANCGTVTLGDSGDTVAIPSGVTLTSAGSITNSGTITNTGTISGGTITGNIEGQVSWQTTVKTGDFTAANGEGYFVNTTSGAITVTLPSSPSAGNIVGIKDYANTADTNNITIGRNGSNIQGTANNFTISTEGLSIVLLYVDSTKGWLSVGQAKASDITEQALFTTATGGTITTSGDFKIHTFTGPGTFCVSQIGNGPSNPSGGPATVSYLVIAGGGGSGRDTGGGGGGGGFREGRDLAPSYTASPLVNSSGLPISVQGYPITVGAGGSAGGPDNCSAAPSGASSIFSSITSAGGGGGGKGGGGANVGGGNGGSGGGGGSTPSAARPGGTGNTPPVSPPQGKNGGDGGSGTGNAGGGGGGANEVGQAGTNPPRAGGPGGSGVITEINGSPVRRAGGGGGGGACSPGSAGSGGGGAGSGSPSSTGANGTANTGGGAGGGGPSNANSGGSGIVIIRYKFQ